MLEFAKMKSVSPQFLALGLLFTSPAFAFESTLPLMYLNTGKAEVNKTDPVEVKVSLLSEERNNSRDLPHRTPDWEASLKIRGYSSALWLKHQYSLQLHESGDAKKNLDISLLGLPEHHNWVLAAPYSDRALIRNAFAFELARGLDSPEHPFWAPHFRPMELFLNGKYQGVYYLTEKVDRSKNRLNLGKPDLKNPEASPFMVKIEHSIGQKPEEYFTTPANVRVNYEDPNPAKFAELRKQDPAGTARFVANIRKTITRFESAVLAIEVGNYASYRAQADLGSFIDFFLVQEVLKNVDGFRRSMNVHFKNGLLHMGPVWDFDLTLGNLRLFGEMDPAGFQSGHGKYIDGGEELFWFKTMLKDPSFRHALVRRYHELRGPDQAFATARLVGLIDRLTAELGPAAERNFSVWDPNMKLKDGLMFFLVPKYSNFRPSMAVADMRNFLLQRLDWLDRNIDHIGLQ